VLSCNLKSLICADLINTWRKTRMQKEYGQQSAKPLAFLFGKKAHAGRYDDRRAGFAAIPLHFGGSKPFDIGLGYLRGA